MRTSRRPTPCSPSMSLSPVAGPAVAVQALCRNHSRPPRTAAGGRRGMRAIRIVPLTAVLIAVGALAAPVSHAQDWPSRAVKVVVPFGAGGAADRLGRIAADHLSRAFKQ